MPRRTQQDSRSPSLDHHPHQRKGLGVMGWPPLLQGPMGVALQFQGGESSWSDDDEEEAGTCEFPLGELRCTRVQVVLSGDRVKG